MAASAAAAAAARSTTRRRAAGGRCCCCRRCCCCKSAAAVLRCCCGSRAAALCASAAVTRRRARAGEGGGGGGGRQSWHRLRSATHNYAHATTSDPVLTRQPAQSPTLCGRRRHAAATGCGDAPHVEMDAALDRARYEQRDACAGAARASICWAMERGALRAPVAGSRQAANTLDCQEAGAGDGWGRGEAALLAPRSFSARALELRPLCLRNWPLVRLVLTRRCASAFSLRRSKPGLPSGTHGHGGRGPGVPRWAHALPERPAGPRASVRGGRRRGSSESGVRTGRRVCAARGSAGAARGA